MDTFDQVVDAVRGSEALGFYLQYELIILRGAVVALLVGWFLQPRTPKRL